MADIQTDTKAIDQPQPQKQPKQKQNPKQKPKPLFSYAALSEPGRTNQWIQYTHTDGLWLFV